MVAPVAHRLNTTPESRDSFPHGLFDAMGQHGIYRIPFLADVGGRGLQYPTLATVTVLEEIAYFSASAASALYEGQAILVGKTLDRAPAYLQARYLPPVVRGELVGAFATSKPDASTDLSPGMMRTTATEVPGGWRSHGRKRWITNAVAADFILVLCRTGDAQSFLAVDPLDLGGEPLEHPLSGLAADLVDDLDQKIDKPIREFTLPMREEQRIKSMTPVVRMPAHGPSGLVEHAAPEHPCNGAAQIRTCGNRQRQTLHEGKPLGCDQDIVEVGLARIGFQIREAGRAILLSKRSVKPATMLGRQGRGDRLQHLVLKRAAGGDDQRAQGVLAGSCDLVLDEPAEETLHHPRYRQSQGAQYGNNQPRSVFPIRSASWPLFSP